MSHKVDVDHRLEPVGAEAADRHGEVSRRIVDHDVELTERSQHFLDDSRHLVGTAHVTNAVGRLNPLLPQRRNRGLEVGFLPAADSDASPMTAQYPSDLQPQPGSAAGD